MSNLVKSQPALTPEEKRKKQEEAARKLEEANEIDMLQKLSQIARGWDMLGMRVSQSEMLSAQQQYHKLKDMIDQRRLQREKMALDWQIESNRLSTQSVLEHRRLDIEEEKVRVQKGELVVKALELAVQAGADPNLLLTAVENLKQTLLPEQAAARLLPDKSNS